MKYHAAQALALASIASAFPHPQLPTFTLPNGGLVSDSGSGSGSSSSSGSGLGSGLGGGSGLNSGLGGLGSGLGGGLGSGLGGGGFSLPTSIPSLGGLGGLGGGSSSSGSSLSGLLSGLFGGLGGGSLGGGLGGGFSTPISSATPTKTSSPISAPIATGGVGEGTNSATPTTPAPVTNPNCKPQSGTASPFGGSENGVKENACCTDMTVIFARGTGEMGNVGTVSGPPMFKAIRAKLGNDRVTVQGVDYAASAAGNINLGGDGGQKMADLVQLAKKQCPSTKIIVSGYSQGAMVVHNAFSKGVSAEDVAGAVMFGDPLKRQAISGLAADKIKEFCGTADQICGGGGDGGATGSHLSYGSSAEAAATFAIQAAGLA
ncbi:Cutinase [Pyrenophora teres f. maculata]|nr:Cutinase [Pyrenophora teres f. maculata]